MVDGHSRLVTHRHIVCRRYGWYHLSYIARSARHIRSIFRIRLLFHVGILWLGILDRSDANRCDAVYRRLCGKRLGSQAVRGLSGIGDREHNRHYYRTLRHTSLRAHYWSVRWSGYWRGYCRQQLYQFLEGWYRLASGAAYERRG